MDTMEQFIAREKERLTNERTGLLEQRSALDAKVAALDTEFGAIAAYEAAKTGKALVVTTGKTVVGGGRKARRGSIREDLLATIRTIAPASRGDILEHFGFKGNKAKEMSVSNALTALTKNGQVTRASGKYQIAA